MKKIICHLLKSYCLLPLVVILILAVNVKNVLATLDNAPDFRNTSSLTTNNVYPPFNTFANWHSVMALRSQCVEVTNVWTIGSYALLAPAGISEDDFISSSRQEIENTLESYVEDNPLLDTETHNLLVLDIEHPIDPKMFGEFLADPRFNALIEAFKLRIDVARNFFPNAKLSLFNVIVPQSNANEDNPSFITRIQGYEQAGTLGLYDQLDYLSPNLYVQWGPDDGNKFNTIEAYTHMGINFTTSLPGAKPLVPFLSPKIRNRNSSNFAQLVPIDTARYQFDYLRQHPEVEKIVYWANGNPDRDLFVSSKELLYFFRELDPCN